MAHLATIVSTPSHHRNLIRDSNVSLAQYRLHYRDADEPIITNTLHLLLHERPDKSLLGQPHTTKCYDSNIPLTITDNLLEHSPYSHNHVLHQWFRVVLRHPFTDNGHHIMQPPLLMYEVEIIGVAFARATESFHQDITQYLSFTEWRTTLSQHPTMIPSHPLLVPLTD